MEARWDILSSFRDKMSQWGRDELMASGGGFAGRRIFLESIYYACHLYAFLISPLNLRAGMIFAQD
ncbi:MAG: hypothetical protein D6736_01215 [Nitrospinota bacterium]|nr:MAG: hypothetical protein D6736_01215 [Nitrospinota bacterium]